MGADARVPVHLHRQHRRLGDGRDRPPAVGRLRPAAHRRTRASPASSVPAGTGIFTLLGFAGLYLFVGILYLVLIVRIVNRGPDDPDLTTTSTQASAGSS